MGTEVEGSYGRLRLGWGKIEGETKKEGGGEGGGDGRPAKGKGEGSRGNARPGKVRRGTERRRDKGRGDASQKLGSPSILHNQNTHKNTRGNLKKTKRTLL
jgi:hypothetical protein